MHGEKGNTIELLSLVALERDIQTKAQPRAMAVEWKKEGEGRVTERETIGSVITGQPGSAYSP